MIYLTGEDLLAALAVGILTGATAVGGVDRLAAQLAARRAARHQPGPRHPPCPLPCPCNAQETTRA